MTALFLSSASGARGNDATYEVSNVAFNVVTPITAEYDYGIKGKATLNESVIYAYDGGIEKLTVNQAKNKGLIL